MRLDFFEELPCREVEGHVRLLEGVYHHHVIGLVRRAHEGAAVASVDVEVRLIHPEIAPPHIHNRRVYLDAVNRYWPVGGAVLARNRSRRQPDDSDTPQLIRGESLIKVGGHQQIFRVPRRPEEYAIRVVFGVDRARPLVQNEVVRAVVVPHDLNVVVE